MVKKNIFLFAGILLATILRAQTPVADSLAGFDWKHFGGHLASFKGTESERVKYIERVKRAYINRKYNIIKPQVARQSSNSSIQSLCSNVDFESGNTSGWTVTGDYQITSGAALDTFGVYPVVYPGGNHSLKLGSNNLTTSSFTSTASTVITVGSSNPFFSLHYALDFLDFPHDSLSTSRFSVQFFDPANNLIPCPSFDSYHYFDGTGNPKNVNMNYAQQTWGSDTFPTSGPGVNLGSQNFPVTYQNWQTTTVDLRPYMGTYVTCVITSTWCIYAYDWAYCYIDADCNSSPVSASNPICAGGSTVLLGPPGMASYNWAGPVTGSTQNLTTSVTGNYTLTTTSTSSCIIGGSFTYNVSYASPGSYPSITIQALHDTICIGDVDTLKTSGASTCTWSSNALGATNDSVYVSPTSNETYTVTGYDSVSHCTNTVTKLVAVLNCSMGINQKSVTANQLRVYPNPAHDNLTVECKIKNAELFITDVLGNKVMQINSEKEKSNIDISHLSKGIYFLNVKSAESNFTQKIIVQR